MYIKKDAERSHPSSRSVILHPFHKELLPSAYAVEIPVQSDQTDYD